jgi:hypothetical protein
MAIYENAMGEGLLHRTPAEPDSRRTAFVDGYHAWLQETGSNRRRRPFQGLLPTDLSGLESAEAIDKRYVRAVPF